jgi:F-type H+-transporting ATPase subunit delta
MSMRGASAEARAHLVDQLDRALGSGAADAARLGDDLFGVASVLRSEPGLRRIATDVSTDSNAKSGLVRSIFEGRLSQPALDLVAEAVRRRWTSSRDLADTLEELGVRAVVHSAGDSPTDAGRLSDELFTVHRLVEGDAGLRAALTDAGRSVADRRQLLAQLLDGRAQAATVTLAQQALSGSYRTPGVALEAYEKIAASVHRQRVAQVHVAQALSDTEQTRLQQALSRQYGREVHVNVVVDPGLLGGMRVEIGEDVIDGTVAARLDEARRRLAG